MLLDAFFAAAFMDTRSSFATASEKSFRLSCSWPMIVFAFDMYSRFAEAESELDDDAVVPFEPHPASTPASATQRTVIMIARNFFFICLLSAPLP